MLKEMQVKKIDRRILFHTLGKIGGSIMIIALVFSFILIRSPLKTLSPDSIRFIHFWQINADHFKAEGGNVKSALKVIYFSLKSSNAYDVNRDRFVQYFLYGIDSFTRWMLPSPMINILMILLLIVNSGLIAWIATKTVLDRPVRINLFCLAWVMLVSTSLIISPVILLILYAKYVWVTFVLAYFICHSKILKVILLIAAAFSDEIGLFAAMIISFTTVMRFSLSYYNFDSISNSSPKYHTLKACLFGTIASFTILFVIYGISSVIFDQPASGFRNFAFAGGKQLTQVIGWSSSIKGLLFQAEVIVLGSSLNYQVITFLVGIFVIVVILIGVLKTGRSLIYSEELFKRNLNNMIRKFLNNESFFFYMNWIFILLIISFIVLRGGARDYTHYSYPAFAVLSILFIRALLDILSPRVASIFLFTIFSLHLIMLPRSVKVTSNSLSLYLFPDGTVSSDDINAITKSVLELRENGISPFFDTLNNRQEIDYSGTWFYSRVKGFGTATGPYFPVQGTVKVLLWPNKLN